MKSRARLALTAASLALAGCASMQAPQSGGACNENVCHVSLNITTCRPHGSSVTAYPDPAHIGRGAHEIHFDIASTGYEFTANGIAFKQPGPGVFSGPQKLEASKFKWHDNNAAAGSYDYNIEVMSASGSICRADPTIVND
jgi:hypothetical protein